LDADSVYFGARGTPAAMLSLRTAVKTRRIRSVGLKLAALCGVLLLAGFGCFIWFLPDQEVMLDRNADGIVVLTGGTSRVSDALELLSSGRGKRLLITGVNPGTTTASTTTIPPSTRWATRYRHGAGPWNTASIR